MGQYLIAPFNCTAPATATPQPGDVGRQRNPCGRSRLSDTVCCATNVAIFSTIPANWHCAAAFRDFAAALLTADPARGMKTPNSEPDGRRGKTQSAAHLGRSSLWPGGGACAW